ncbi:hypothetical protein ACA910_006481 [Epithemia clementina (nom. ined.)]
MGSSFRKASSVVATTTTRTSSSALQKQPPTTGTTISTNGDMKAQCTDLIRILYGKMLEQEHKEQANLGSTAEVPSTDSWDDSLSGQS